MNSMIIRAVKNEADLATVKGALVGHGYSIVFEGAADTVDFDLSYFDTNNLSLNDAIIVIGMYE